MNNQLYWVWLTLTFGAAVPEKWAYLSTFTNIKVCYELSQSGDICDEQKAMLKRTKVASAKDCEQLIEYCLKNGIKLYCYDDKNYPERLRGIFNPPCVLFVMGNIDGIDDELTVSVIGARHPSEYSVRAASRISYELARVGTVIVSGFALGIDSVAHKGAIEGKSKTIAVLGCGIDYDYPKENSAFKTLIAENGAVITEYPPKTKPYPTNFVARNRIIAALSLAVVVVEASSSSGTLNTAGYALTYGRDIFCIPPHDIFDERYRGQAALLRDGATPVFSHTDVMFPYYSEYSHKLSLLNFGADVELEASDKVSEKANKADKSKDKKAIKKDNSAKKHTSKKQSIENDDKQKENEDEKTLDFSSLSEAQAKICSTLSERSMLADELSSILNMKIETVLYELTELEIFGFVSALSGRRYKLNK